MYCLMGDAENIILFPYWCEKELERFKLIGMNWKKLTHTNLKLRFVFVGRWDCNNIDIKKYSKVFEKYGVVSHVVLSTPQSLSRKPTRHDFAKHMFVKTMKYINRFSKSNDGGFVLWMESDVMFLKNQWLNKLYDEWSKQKNTLLMGHLVSYKNDTDQIKRNFPNHINGVACYAKNIIEYIPENTFYTSYRSFDVIVYNHLVKSKLTNRIICSEQWKHQLDFDCNEVEFDEVDSDKIILHGCKSNKTFNKLLNAQIKDTV